MQKMIQAALALLVVVAPLGAVRAQDDGPASSYGVRAGFGLDPDQFVLGAQAEMGRIAEVLRVAPSFDVGFGDDVTAYVLNADLRADIIPLPRSGAAIYFGAGPTFTYLDFSEDFGIGDSDTEIGFSLAGGVKLPMGRSNSYNFEARFGIGDIPEFRLLLGVLFGGADRDADRPRSEPETGR